MVRDSAIVTVLVLLGAAGLTGCSTSDSPAALASLEVESVMTDQETCAAFGDVITIQFNAELALRDGRVAQQEHDGWLALATRVLHRVPTRGEGAVSEAIDALKHAAPPVWGGLTDTAGIGSDPWNDAQQRLASACASEGAELAVMAFTGG